MDDTCGGACNGQQEQINNLRERIAGLAARNAEQANAYEQYRQGLDKRLETMNEFRAALKDDSLSYVRRSEYEGRHEGLAGIVQRIERTLPTLVSSEQLASLQKYIYMAIGGLAVFGAIMQILLYLMQRAFH